MVNDSKVRCHDLFVIIIGEDDVAVAAQGERTSQRLFKPPSRHPCLAQRVESIDETMRPRRNRSHSPATVRWTVISIVFRPSRARPVCPFGKNYAAVCAHFAAHIRIVVIGTSRNRRPEPRTGARPFGASVAASVFPQVF
jgi:hypothetical protein